MYMQLYMVKRKNWTDIVWFSDKSEYYSKLDDLNRINIICKE